MPSEAKAPSPIPEAAASDVASGPSSEPGITPSDAAFDSARRKAFERDQSLNGGLPDIDFASQLIAASPSKKKPVVAALDLPVAPLTNRKEIFVSPDVDLEEPDLR